jgi:hypothetical protein
MASTDELTSDERRGRVEAELEDYWGPAELLSAPQRRRRDTEHELRLSLAGRREEPAPWLIAEIRSGVWERRQRRNMRNFRLSVARWNTWRREQRGAAPTTTTPQTRARESRPRTARRSTSTASSRDDPPGEPDPPLGRDPVTDSRPAPRACEFCGETFRPRRRSNARICKNACKQAAYRGRRADRAKRRSQLVEEACELIRDGELDPALALSFVVWPSDALAELCAA